MITPKTDESSPQSRNGNGFIYNSNDKVFLLFGGTKGFLSDKKEDYLSDTWIYNPSTKNWTKMITSTSPAGRWLFGLVYAPDLNKAFLFGGSTELPTLNDLWEYDFKSNSWSIIKSESKHLPAARSAFGMVYLDKHKTIIMFGGATDCYPTSSDWKTFNCSYDGGTWEYSPYTKEWNLRKSASDTTPVARSDHVMAYDSFNDKVILFGGSINAMGKEEGTLGDTWAYDYESNTWTNMKPSMNPPARFAHAMAYDKLSRKVILYGGYTGEPTNKLFNDVLAYDYKTNGWEQLKLENAPLPRLYTSMDFDVQTGNILAFGGVSDKGISNDLVELRTT